MTSPHHLALTWRQGVVSSSQFCLFYPFLARRAIALERLM